MNTAEQPNLGVLLGRYHRSPGNGVGPPPDLGRKGPRASENARSVSFIKTIGGDRHDIEF